MNVHRISLFIIFTLLISLSSCQIINRSVETKIPTEGIISTITPKDTKQIPVPVGTSTLVNSEDSTNESWWLDSVFYEIYVRSFYDSNGDGIGDFNGITQKMNYLNDGDPATTEDLGITAIWLMPVMSSPSTHGYDVTDYYQVNEQYGTMDDFKKMLDLAHSQGIKVILDLPINHTSSEHPWFVQSQDTQSPYREWYIWSDTDPGYPGPWGNVVWHPLNGDFFYGYFWEGMPDLNYRNPEVTREMENIAKFWLQDIGVDGFRLDAIGALIEDGEVQVGTVETHRWFRNFQQFCKSINPATFTVGEIWEVNEIVAPYVANREVDLAFNFDLSFAIVQGINSQDPSIIENEIVKSKALFPYGKYGTFVTNHDMDRGMTQFGSSLEKAKIAASVYLTLPGVPFVYYGEEIGMSGVASDEQGRLPMQWSSDPYAGFSTVDPWSPPQPDFGIINVHSELEDPSSLLAHYQKLITIRNSNDIFRKGEIYVNEGSNQRIYSITVSYRGKVAIVVMNFSDQPIVDFTISQPANILSEGDHPLVLLYGTEASSWISINASGSFIEFAPSSQIPAYGTIIFQIE
jgi:glycosidase